MPTAIIFLAIGRTTSSCKTKWLAVHICVGCQRGGVPRILPRYHLQRPRPILRKEANHSQLGRSFHVHRTCDLRRRSSHLVPRALSSELKALATVQLLPFCNVKLAPQALARGRPWHRFAWFCFRGRVSLPPASTIALRSGYSLIASRISTTDASAKTVTCVNPFELLVHWVAAARPQTLRVLKSKLPLVRAVKKGLVFKNIHQ